MHATRRAEFLIALSATLGLSGCAGDEHLRGFVAQSPDGKTYLAIADDQDGCPIKVDGEAWSTPASTPRSIAPGEHLIECSGAEIRFVVPEGVVFHFDYWGP